MACLIIKGITATIEAKLVLSNFASIDLLTYMSIYLLNFYLILNDFTIRRYTNYDTNSYVVRLGEKLFFRIINNKA